MSTRQTQTFSAEFKANAALESTRGEQLLQELASRLERHPNMITT